MFGKPKSHSSDFLLKTVHFSPIKKLVLLCCSTEHNLKKKTLCHGWNTDLSVQLGPKDLHTEIATCCRINNKAWAPPCFAFFVPIYWALCANQRCTSAFPLGNTSCLTRYNFNIGVRFDHFPGLFMEEDIIIEVSITICTRSIWIKR